MAFGRLTKEDVRRRYLTDALFHARVDLAINKMQADHAIMFEDQDLSLAIEVAGWAIFVTERWP